MTHDVDKMVLRPAQVADALQISRSKSYELIAAGEIPSVLVGGCKRVPVEALRQWIDRQLAARAKSAEQAR
jgi:excisionase family DNA binding protein